MTFDRIPYLFLLLAMVSASCGDSTESTYSDSGVFTSTDSSIEMNTDDYSTDDNYVDVMASCDNVVTNGVIWLTDATNYSFESNIAVQDVTVKSAADLTFDWSNVSTDIFGKKFNPALDVNMVLVALWGMTPDVLAENVRKDNLPIADNKGAIAFYPPAGVPFTSQTLYNFTSPDGSEMSQADFMRFFDTTAPDYAYPQNTHTFMLIAASGTTIGKNNRMFGFFHLDPNAPDTTVFLNDKSMQLNFKTNLQKITPIPIPAETGALTASWEYMTQNALGNKFVPTQITEVMVGHYTNLNRPQLDNQFLNLREIADSTWSGKVPLGYSMDLSTLLNDVTGQPFAGIDNTGVWILALFCGKNCNNPAPWSITILQAC